MAPRKTTKTAANATEGMEMILAVEPLKTIIEAAEYVGISGLELQEKLSEALNLPAALSWETLPSEHGHLLNEFKAQVNGTQAIPEALEQLKTQQELEAPSVSDEVLQSGGKMTKAKQSKLTKGKADKLKESDKTSQQIGGSNHKTKDVLHARKGQKSGARLATIELAAEDLTYRKIMSEGLVRKTAQLTAEVAAEEGLDPIELLKELGLDSNDELLKDLRSQIEPALGKLESATAEIVDSAWLNGIDLQEELTALNNLLDYEL